MEKKETNRREWIKNAAIVFLTVMLLLTFFSNTIMNYSLPEVAAQYVESGSITAKIRGTGTVESGDPYKVKIDETRTIESVLVKVGDKVDQGAPLFKLADKESAELKAKEKELDDSMLAFETDLLSGLSASAFQTAQSGRSLSAGQYQSMILAAETEIEKWEKRSSELQTQLAQLELKNSQLEYATADTTAEAREVFHAEQKKTAKEAEIASVEEELKIWTTKISELTAKIEGYKISIAEWEARKSTVSSGDAAHVDEEIAQLRQSITNAEAERNQINANTSGQQSRLLSLKTELYGLSEALNKAMVNLEAKKGNNGTKAAIGSDKYKVNQAKEEADTKLAQAKEKKTQLLTDISKELGMEAKSKSISKLQTEVAELRAKAVGATVEAPIAGTIIGIDVTAGADTVPGTPFATIQPEGKGFTMSFSVTNEQAKKLSVGMKAELVNAWNYEGVTVALTGMKPDPQNPSQNKLLTFDVNGNVTTGQSLSVAVGDKSANYDKVVPNSAIREDNNGKFVLVVESKSSPLSTRYIATRVDVEVLGSDDKQTAVSGALESYAFVITTSNKPVEAGKQVRLANDQK